MSARHNAWQVVRRMQGLLAWPPLRELASREYIDFLSTRTAPRPRPFSLFSSPTPGAEATDGTSADYVSWVSLSDRGYTGRHLPAASPVSAEPSLDAAAALFARGEQGFQPDLRSNVLFMFFAQWFTDSIFRTDQGDTRRNTSSHDIDLCQIYGLDAATTQLLREGSTWGRLRSRTIAGSGEYPDLLCESGRDGAPSVRARYQGLPYAQPGRLVELVFKAFPQAQERMGHLYAAGLDVGNSSIGYTAISTIFLREHNRLCARLHDLHGWGDERLFQTARAINIVLLLKILIEDYVNHILGMPLFLLQPGFAERRGWYRPNWMALEFNLLYRWHGLVPDALSIDGSLVAPGRYRYNNELLETLGVEAVIDAAAAQQAGRVGLHNTPAFLLPAERKSLELGRGFRLQGYNAYRRQFGLKPLESFDQLAPSQVSLARELEAMYGSVDRLEFVVGVFAEEAQPGSLFGDLMTRMVAYDALTQIFSNPLLSKNVFNAETFTRFGLDTIAETTSFRDLVARNVEPSRIPRASLAVGRAALAPAASRAVADAEAAAAG